MKINRTNLNLKITVLITYLIMVITNGLANIIPINGVMTGEVSDSYENLFAPAGVTFSVWGVIYALLFFYIIYQFGIFQKKNDSHREDLFQKIGIYFALTSVLNTVWIFTWHYKIIEVSLIIIIAILVLLILINNKTRKMRSSLKDYFFIRLPFSVYMGWITVATIANVTTLLVKLGFDGFGLPETFWTILVIIVGLIIASLTIIRNKDLAYGLTVIWAYIGIYIKHTSNSGWSSNYSSIIFTVVAAILLLLVVEGYTLVNLRKGDSRIRDI
ncbi:MAG: hypothetical protein ACTHW2_00620 [Tissierella sp.]|uniref:hypothetical protein n=1 Tax=Tissierella sp. TaxID=41274 RepID=UPI003F9C1885